MLHENFRRYFLGPRGEMLPVLANVLTQIIQNHMKSRKELAELMDGEHFKLELKQEFYEKLLSEMERFLLHGRF